MDYLVEGMNKWSWKAAHNLLPAAVRLKRITYMYALYGKGLLCILHNVVVYFEK